MNARLTRPFHPVRQHALLAALLLGLSSGQAAAIVLQYDYQREASWLERGFSYGDTLLGWDRSLDKSSYSNPTVPEKCITVWGSKHCAGGWSLGTYGGGITAGTSGQVGYQLDAAVDTGGYTLRYPVDIRIDPAAISTNGNGSRRIRFRTDYDLKPDAGLDTRAGGAGVRLQTDLAMKAKLEAKSCYGADCSTVTPVDYELAPSRIPLVDLDSAGTALDLTSDMLSTASAAAINALSGGTLGGLGSQAVAGLLPDLGFRYLRLASPDVATHSSLGKGGRIDTARRDTFFNLGWNLTELVESLGCRAYFSGKSVGTFNPVRALCPDLAGSLSWGVGNINYNLLDVMLDIGVGVEQLYSYQPVLMGAISSGGQRHEFVVGDDVEMDVSGGDLLDFSSEFWLDGMLSVTDRYFLQPSVHLTGLALEAVQSFADPSFDLGNTSFSRTVKDGCRTWLPWPLDYLCDAYNWVTETTTRTFGSVTATISDVHLGPYGPVLDQTAGGPVYLAGNTQQHQRFTLGSSQFQVNTQPAVSVPTPATLPLFAWGILWLLWRRHGSRRPFSPIPASPPPAG